jgi:hypothetical protein
VDGLLDQIEDDGRLTASGALKLMPWSDVYDLLEGKDGRNCQSLLGIPTEFRGVPTLRSEGSLSDEAFAISLTGWRDEETGKPIDIERRGAVVIEGQRYFGRGQPRSVRTGKTAGHGGASDGQPSQLPPTSTISWPARSS